MKSWREGLPVHHCDAFTLREVEDADAPSLAQHLSSEEVRQSVSSPPPRTVTAIERWINNARTKRAAGSMACFAIVPPGAPNAAGVIQLWRSSDTDASLWEMGFVLGREFWGTGLFQKAAQTALAVAFDSLQATLVEANCLVENARGNRALEKLGGLHTGTDLRVPDPDGNIGDFKKWEFRPHKPS
jgi:ribosomal-protein-alanine N-acetyltransferase